MKWIGEFPVLAEVSYVLATTISAKSPGPKGGATGYGNYILWPRNITLKAAA